MKSKHFKIVATVLYLLLMAASFAAFAFGNLLPSLELLISLFVLIMTASYLYVNRKRRNHQ